MSMAQECADTDTGMGMGTIRRYYQFLKNYNMIKKIRDRYNTDTTQI